MAATWKSRANSYPMPSSTLPPPWRTVLRWPYGSTTWRRGPLPRETHSKGLRLLARITISPLHRLPLHHRDPPPTVLLPVTYTLCISTSATALTIASMGGKAAEIRGSGEAGSSRAVKMDTCLSTHRPLYQQPSTH